MNAGSTDYKQNPVWSNEPISFFIRSTAVIRENFILKIKNVQSYSWNHLKSSPCLASSANLINFKVQWTLIKRVLLVDFIIFIYTECKPCVNGSSQNDTCACECDDDYQGLLCDGKIYF